MVPKETRETRDCPEIPEFPEGEERTEASEIRGFQVPVEDQGNKGSSEYLARPAYLAKMASVGTQANRANQVNVGRPVHSDPGVSWASTEHPEGWAAGEPLVRREGWALPDLEECPVAREIKDLKDQRGRKGRMDQWAYQDHVEDWVLRVNPASRAQRA